MRKLAFLTTLSVLSVARITEFDKEKFFEMVQNSEQGRDMLSSVTRTIMDKVDPLLSASHSIRTSSFIDDA